MRSRSHQMACQKACALCAGGERFLTFLIRMILGLKLQGRLVLGSLPYCSGNLLQYIYPVESIHVYSQHKASEDDLMQPPLSSIACLNASQSNATLYFHRYLSGYSLDFTSTLSSLIVTACPVLELPVPWHNSTVEAPHLPFAQCTFL